jgi:hypothetical protein
MREMPACLRVAVLVTMSILELEYSHDTYLSMCMYLSTCPPVCAFVYVCGCVRICQFVSVRDYLYVYIYLYISLSTFIYHVYSCANVCVCVRICVRAHCGHVCPCLCIYVCVCLCKHTCRSPWRDKKQGHPSLQWQAPPTPDKTTTEPTRTWPSSTRQGRPQSPPAFCPLLGRGWRKGGQSRSGRHVPTPVPVPQSAAALLGAFISTAVDGSSAPWTGGSSPPPGLGVGDWRRYGGRRLGVRTIPTNANINALERFLNSFCPTGAALVFNRRVPLSPTCSPPPYHVQ